MRKTTGVELARLEQATDPAHRYVNLAVCLRSLETKQPILCAGGRWDTIAQKFTPEAPKRALSILLAEGKVGCGQAGFARWYAEWLGKFRRREPRDCSIAIAGGDRRGGKTFVLVVLAFATAMDIPAVDGSPLIVWIVAANYQERDEIERTISETFPEITDANPGGWYQHWRAPEFRYRLINGAGIKIISADDPDTLKRGRCDLLLFNEAQKMRLDALVNGISGTTDKGGLTVLAANPPRKQRGAWVRELKLACDSSSIEGAKFFEFSSKDNPFIDAAAKQRTGAIIRTLDPDAARRDDDGQWDPVGSRAYSHWDAKKNTGTPPDLGDVTTDVSRRRIGRPFPLIAGADFQAHPGNAGVFVRAFGDCLRPTYYVVDEILRDGWEDEFLDDVFDKGYEPERLLWIGDASGAWQDGHHSRGRVSYDVFKARRWRVEPPRKKKSDRGEHPANPDVFDRLALVNKLLGTGRLLVDPIKCPLLTTSLDKCETWPSGKPKGKYAHLTDALGYVLWWMEPEAKPQRRNNEAQGGSFPNMRPGTGLY